MKNIYGILILASLAGCSHGYNAADTAFANGNGSGVYLFNPLED